MKKIIGFPIVWLLYGTGYLVFKSNLWKYSFPVYWLGHESWETSERVQDWSQAKGPWY